MDQVAGTTLFRRTVRFVRLDLVLTRAPRLVRMCHGSHLVTAAVVCVLSRVRRPVDEARRATT